jgi:glycosyltransferase involved in cell wall biosynthesis
VLDKPVFRKYYQKIFPLYPVGIRSLNLKQDYDLIISSESGPIKGINNPHKIPHLCYIHTPMRYCWGFTQEYLNVLPKSIRPFAKLGFESLREYDKTTIDSVNKYITNSHNVRDRVRQYYNRDAEVVFGPLSLDLFKEDNLVQSRSTDREYYLSFGAITPYKGIGLLVDTFNTNGRKLLVIGDGSERKKIEAHANSNITFLGTLPYPKIQEYILGAKALIFPGEEDFGLIPLEVMAHGVPVLAYARGGALETVHQNLDNSAEGTGLFFYEQSFDGLQNCIDSFEKIQNDFDPVFIRSHARQFGEDFFKEKVKAQVLELLASPSKIF